MFLETPNSESVEDTTIREGSNTHYENRFSLIKLDLEKNGVREETQKRLLALSSHLPKTGWILKSPVELMRDEAKDLHTTSVSSRIKLAENYYIKEMPEVVNQLARDTDYRVREALARNGWLFTYAENVETAVRLIHDEEESVRFAMVKHAYYTFIYARDFADQYKEETSPRIKKHIREYVFRFARLRGKYLEFLQPNFTSKDPLTRIHASKNLSLVLAYPSEAKKLFRDENSDVRLAIAKSGLVKLFPEQAKQFAHDPNKEVRSAYFANINAED